MSGLLSRSKESAGRGNKAGERGWLWQCTGGDVLPGILMDRGNTALVASVLRTGIPGGRCHQEYPGPLFLKDEERVGTFPHC